ncbi:hypothetical protein SEVIR_2G254101v4 [Setaria viridis]|nr:cellulose synthase-like protein E1 [Setaria viridis]
MTPNARQQQRSRKQLHLDDTHNDTTYYRRYAWCSTTGQHTSREPAPGPAGRRGWGCWWRSCGLASTGSSRSLCSGAPSDDEPSRTGLVARFGEQLPCVDIFVCTADPQTEPPSLVISTVLSVMAYNYPAEKLSMYLSDDGCSILTFYALWEASVFAEHWLPFCKRCNIEPRSPAAYFSESDNSNDLYISKECSFIKVISSAPVEIAIQAYST